MASTEQRSIDNDTTNGIEEATGNTLNHMTQDDVEGQQEEEGKQDKSLHDTPLQDEPLEDVKSEGKEEEKAESANDAGDMEPDQDLETAKSRLTTRIGAKMLNMLRQTSGSFTGRSGTSSSASSSLKTSRERRKEGDEDTPAHQAIPKNAHSTHSSHSRHSRHSEIDDSPVTNQRVNTHGVGLSSVKKVEKEDREYMLPTTGVNLDLFLKEFGPQLKKSGQSIQDIVRTVILPYTKATKQSVAQMWREMEGVPDQAASPRTAKANRFISYCSQHKSTHLVEVLEGINAKSKEQAPDTTLFIWMDILCVNPYYKDSAYLKEYIHSKLQESIGEIGHTVAIFSPALEPLNLQRIWCLWELSETVDVVPSVKLDIEMPQADYNHLKKSLVKDFAKTVDSWCKGIDIKKAKSQKSEELSLISTIIQKHRGGTMALNRRIADFMRKWMTLVALNEQNRLEAKGKVKEFSQKNLKQRRKIAQFLKTHEFYAHAEPVLRKILRVAEKVEGEESEGTASVLFDLADSLKAQDGSGKSEEAEKCFRQSIEITKKLVGENHPTTATRMNGLAMLLTNLKRDDEAEPLFRNVVAIRQQVFGDGHSHVAHSLNNLGMCLKAVGKLEEAETVYREALSIKKSALGTQHITVAASLNNLAELLRVQQRFKEAEPLYREGLVIKEMHLGSKHPSVAKAKHNLAEMLRQTDRPDAARAMGLEAYNTRLELFGPDHPATQNSRFWTTF